MAEIVQGLFGVSPELFKQQQDAQFQQQQIALAQLDPQQQRFLQMGEAGRAVGRGVGSLFGAQDPILAKQAAETQLLQEVQSSLSPEDRQDPYKLSVAVYQAAMAANMPELTNYAFQNMQVARTQAIAQGKDIAITTKSYAEAEKALREKENVVTPQNQAEAIVLNMYVKQQGPEQGALAFAEWKTANQRKVQEGANPSIVPTKTAAGNEIGTFDDKGNFISKKGEFIPKDEMTAYRTEQNAALNLYDVISGVDNTTVDKAFGFPDVTQNAAFRLTANPELVGAQTRINALKVKDTLTNLLALKGPTSDKDMSVVLSTFPGYEADPKVMKQWMVEAKAAALAFTNKRALQYGFEAKKVNLDEFTSDPIFKSLPPVARSNAVEKLLAYDTAFMALPEKEKIAKLNKYVGANTGPAPSVKIGNKTYTKPLNMTDDQWTAYKKSQGL
jgi:hypothetical protein